MMEHTFHIQDDVNDTVLYLSADSESDKTLWINALNKCIERLRSQTMEDTAPPDKQGNNTNVDGKGNRRNML